MKTFFGKILYCLLGGIVVVMGASMFMNPLATLASMATLYGSLILLAGIVSLVRYFITRDDQHVSNEGVAVVISILDIMLGFLILSDVAGAVAIIPFIIAIWLMIRGILAFIVSLNLRKVTNSMWAWLMVSSILTIILGYLGLSNPVVTALSASTLIAFQFIMLGITIFVEGLAYRENR